MVGRPRFWWDALTSSCIILNHLNSESLNVHLFSIFFFIPFQKPNSVIEDSGQMRSFQCLAIPAASKMVGSDPRCLVLWPCQAGTLGDGPTNGPTWWCFFVEVPCCWCKADSNWCNWLNFFSEKDNRILLPTETGSCWRLWISSRGLVGRSAEATGIAGSSSPSAILAPT